VVLIYSTVLQYIQSIKPSEDLSTVESCRRGLNFKRENTERDTSNARNEIQHSYWKQKLSGKVFPSHKKEFRQPKMHVL
jgi:hypothetical protein